MDMHEYLPSHECRGCVGTGVGIKMIIVNGEFMGVMVTDEPCDCCSGTGQHYEVSYQ